MSLAKEIERTQQCLRLARLTARCNRRYDVRLRAEARAKVYAATLRMLHDIDKRIVMIRSEE